MEASKPCEREYDFALVLTGITDLTDDVEDALFEAGCDDATLSIQSGRAYLTFSRRAPSVKDAILSAIRAVRKAKIGADVLLVDECDLVTKSDIARRMNKSRQAVHQYFTGERGPGGFPPPVCRITDDSPLWYWCEVAHWLWLNNMLRADAWQSAEQIAIINRVLELQHQKKIAPKLTEEIIRSIGGCG